jgi:hypothetical protein
MYCMEYMMRQHMEMEYMLHVNVLQTNTIIRKDAVYGKQYDMLRQTVWYCWGYCIISSGPDTTDMDMLAKMSPDRLEAQMSKLGAV